MNFVHSKLYKFILHELYLFLDSPTRLNTIDIIKPAQFTSKAKHLIQGSEKLKKGKQRL